MKRILVPTDFSPTAEKAFLFAIDIAAKSGGSVSLYHVGTSVESETAATATKRKKQRPETGALQLRKLINLKNSTQTRHPGVSVSTILGEGAVVKKINDFVAREHYDLLVMGTQGVSGLKKNIIGSVAAHMIDTAGIPVLLIPENHNGHPPSQIVFATDYQEADREALSFIIKLSQLYNAKVAVVHLYDLYLMEEAQQRRKFDSYTALLKKELNADTLQFKFLKVASIREAMETLDKIVPYDILAMARRQKNLLEKIFVDSFTQNMAYLNTLPLLVLPGNKK